MGFDFSDDNRRRVVVPAKPAEPEANCDLCLQRYPASALHRGVCCDCEWALGLYQRSHGGRLPAGTMRAKGEPCRS